MLTPSQKGLAWCLASVIAPAFNYDDAGAIWAILPRLHAHANMKVFACALSEKTIAHLQHITRLNVIMYLNLKQKEMFTASRTALPKR